MPRYSLLPAMVLLGALAMAAAPRPADRPGRLVDTIDGITLEYSPGQEPYVLPLATALAAWRPEFEAQLAAAVAAEPPPLSAADLLARRDEFLRDVAAAIGLDEPTALQAASYDTFVNHYAIMSETRRIFQVLARRLAGSSEGSLWTRAEVVERLQAGEQIDGFVYDPATDELEFKFGFERQAATPPKEAVEAAEKARLNHAVNYQVKDGIAELTARVSFHPGQTVDAPRRFDHETFAAEVDRAVEELTLMLPVRMEKDGATLSPEEVVAAEIQARRDLAKAALAPPHRDGALAFIVLHETTEVGLIDRYIGSGDRRWWCDGTANYVAWSIARDRAGDEFARSVYDLPAQLAQYADLQRKIRLRRWPAVERQREEDQGTPLDQAHYAFATRAVALMAERHGEDMIAKLWRETGRTPRQRVSMKTVERAYRKLTGDRLSRLIAAAERDPLPAAPAAVAAR